MGPHVRTATVKHQSHFIHVILTKGFFKEKWPPESHVENRKQTPGLKVGANPNQDIYAVVCQHSHSTGTGLKGQCQCVGFGGI